MPDPKSAPTVAGIITGTVLTISLPSNVHEGDVLVSFVRGQLDRDPDTVAPSGWTRISPNYESGTARMTAAFVKVAEADEPGSYDWSTGARAVGSMVVYSKDEVTASLAGRSSGYQGTWVGGVASNPGAGRQSTGYSLSAKPVLQFVFGASEFTEGNAHTPSIPPEGFVQVVTSQTGSGTVGSRTGIWVGARVETADVADPALIGWGHPVSSDAAQSFALQLVDPGEDQHTRGFSDSNGNPVDVYATRANGQTYRPNLYPMYRGFSSVSQMLTTNGFTIAHRGGGGRYPEMSLHAYTQAVRLGYGALEISFGRTSDGVWVGLHDNSINRTSNTSGLGNINTMTWAQVQAYNITNGLQGPPRPYMRWEEIRDTYGASHVLIMDPKNYGWGSYMLEFLDMCDELGPTRVVVKQYASASAVPLAQAARGRGYQCWGHTFEDFLDDPDVQDYLDAWTILGVDINASTEAWDLVRNSGKPIIAHIAYNQSDYTLAMSKGATGVMCSGTHLIPAVGPGSAYLAPEQPSEPDVTTTVAFYGGTEDGADDVAWNTLGSSLGAAVSYYTPNAKQNGQYVLRSWDQTRISRGILPYIHLQSVAWNAAAGANVQYYPWADVAAGVYDDEFIQWANALKDAPAGVSFSFDGEPEVRLESGSHQPVPNPNATSTTWPAGWPQNNDGKNTPEHYAAAQRRIYSIMHPIAPNVDYRFWFAGHELSSYMESFYPGDAYVDSIGIDPYVWAHNPANTTPKQKYEPIVSWIRSRSWGNSKPIGVSETGIDTGHGDAAGAAFWQAMPQACDDLQLSWVTFYNRSNWHITPATYPQSWDAYVAAMQQIASSN